MKVWVVTNYGGGKNYTPSVFNNKKSAVNWLKECTARNIFAKYEGIINDRSSVPSSWNKEECEAIIAFATSNEEDIYIVYNNDLSVVGDPDEGGNIMQIFECEMT